MNRVLRFFAAFVVCIFAIAAAQTQEIHEQVKRPAITGITRVQIFVTDVTKSRDFYEKTLGLVPAASGCDPTIAACFVVNDHQQIQLVVAPSPTPANLIAKVAFATADLAQTRRYLISKGLSPNPIPVDGNDVQHFSLHDPEGHVVSIVQLPSSTASDKTPRQLSTQLIHAGFIVRDRAAEDHFYKDILGLRPYWHGGMKDDQDNWVSLQVPDGTDWIEYMLNVSPNADKRTLGIMNHIALGVPDIHVAQQQLIKNGWKPGEEPKIGRDGKWQLNLYDPDDTRVEFMEFTPVQNPCCSSYTGPHPGSKK